MSEDERSLGKRANELNATIRYTMWSVFKLARPLADDQRSAAADEVQALLDELAGKDVVVRGVYDVAGLRADADVMVGGTPRRRRRCRRPTPGCAAPRSGGTSTRCGRRWRCTGRRSSTAATSRRSWPTRSRAAGSASTRSCGPTSGTCCPTRSAGPCSPSTGRWPAAFPTSGRTPSPRSRLGDYEWMLAFEADELHRIVDLMRELRASTARRHVREEVPFYTGVRKPIAELVADLA